MANTSTFNPASQTTPGAAGNTTSGPLPMGGATTSYPASSRTSAQHDANGQASSDTKEAASNLASTVVKSAQAGVQATRETFQRASNAVADGLRAPAESVDDFVHEQPWTAIGIAAVAGVALGLLFNTTRRWY